MNNQTPYGEKYRCKGMNRLLEWFKRKWIWLLLLALIIGGGSWYWQGRSEESKAVPPVKDDGRVLAEGIVFPVRYAQMVMPLEGMIGEILVREGDLVQSGQPVLRLVRQDAEARVGNAGSNVAKAAAAVNQARVNLADAVRELTRQEKLNAAGAAASQELDKARTAVERNEAALGQALADAAAQQSTLAESSGLLAKTELRAPISGRVAYLDAKVGEHAALGTVLVRIADESAWEVRSDDLTELSIARVHEGGRAILTFDGIPGLEIPGHVRFIRPYGEKKRGDITYTVSIEPESWDNRLRWNMTAQIAILP